MKKVTKKMTAGITMAAVLGLSAVPALATTYPQTEVGSTDVTLVINGDWITADENVGQPFITKDGRTMIPLRLVSEEFGYTTDWQENGSIHITGDEKVDVRLQVGSKDYIADGKEGKFDTAPLVLNGRAYLPARDFTELYGSIYWANDSRTVYIYNVDKTEYRIFDKKMWRVDKDGLHALTMPEGMNVQEVGLDYKGDWIAGQRTVDGKNYVLVNYNMTHSQYVPLFRDDGDHMTYLTDMNATSSFWVEGDTVYCTEGTQAGPWTNQINPNAFYVKNGERENVYNLDFAVNACTIDKKDGVLTATEEDGTVHEIDLSSLTPTSNVTFSLAAGNTPETADKLNVVATNKRTNKSVHLSVPKFDLGGSFTPDELVAYYIDAVKVIDGTTYLGIGRASVMGGQMLDLYAVPNLTDGDRSLTYVGYVPFKTDYTVADGNLYYTDGPTWGPWEVQPNRLYVAKVGDFSTKIEKEMDFAINKCALSVKDGKLIAVEENGNMHTVDLSTYEEEK